MAHRTPAAPADDVRAGLFDVAQREGPTDARGRDSNAWLARVRVSDRAWQLNGCEPQTYGPGIDSRKSSEQGFSTSRAQNPPQLRNSVGGPGTSRRGSHTERNLQIEPGGEGRGWPVARGRTRKRSLYPRPWMAYDHDERHEWNDDGTDRVSWLRGAAVGLDSQPALLAAACRLRRRLPGDETFGDLLSTAGVTPVQVLARSVSALRPGRKSFVKELGLAGLQVWQSLSEATGRGRGDLELAILFTDLVDFSSWALDAGDAAALELLGEVGAVVEAAVIAHAGRTVKRLGDVLMATFLTAQGAVDAALEAQAALQHVELDGYRPRMRAGIHWGRPRRLGGDYLGVDVNIAARVGEAAKADQVLVSDRALARLDLLGLQTGRHKRLRAHGAPRDLRVATVSLAT
jgi:adenylate cyclase